LSINNVPEIKYSHNGSFRQVIHSITANNVLYSLERISDHFIIFKTEKNGFESIIADKKSLDEAKVIYTEYL
jgi:hypothetical protein